jgi:hypothetical protein
MGVSDLLRSNSHVIEIGRGCDGGSEVIAQLLKLQSHFSQNVAQFEAQP